MTGEFSFCANEAARLIRVLAHGSRLEIMALIAHHERNVTSLAEETKLGQPALSRHLKMMRDIGVVQTRRDAQTIYYSCTNTAVVKLVETLTHQSAPPADMEKALKQTGRATF